MKFLLFLLPLAVMACSPKFVIQTETPNPGDFENYGTYKFYNPENIPGSNFSFEDSDKKVIFDAIANQMKSRGYKSVQKADIMIKVQGGTKTSIEIKNDNTIYDPYNNNPYNNRYYNNSYNSYDPYGRNGRYNSRNRDQSKKESSFIIDIIDTKSDKIVWQGVGMGTLSKKETLTEAEINEAIMEIFTKYPYTANESQ